MKPLVLSTTLILMALGCTTQRTAPHSSALPPRLDSYFEQYCDETGNMGIGFAGWDTYLYRFHQQLKTTQDPELKRLFVLANLHREVELALDDFEKGIVMTGQSSSRPLTLPEWMSTRQSIQTRIDDLAAFSTFTNFAKASSGPLGHSDPSLDKDWVEELHGKLRSVTNAPNR